MGTSSTIDTSFLVLRLSVYSESSIIAAGLTPDHGQVHFLVRGARKLGPKAFPALDLFRVLRVQYRDNNADMHRISKADVVTVYADVARHMTAYRTAGWLARFSLLNTPAEVEHPRLFGALCLGLKRLSEIHRHPGHASVVADVVVVGVCLTYLHEGGWLTEPPDGSREAEQCQALLDMAAGTGPAPNLRAENWSDLKAWVLMQLHAADCHVPDLPNLEERQ